MQIFADNGSRINEIQLKETFLVEKVVGEEIEYRTINCEGEFSCSQLSWCLPFLFHLIIVGRVPTYDSERSHKICARS